MKHISLFCVLVFSVVLMSCSNQKADARRELQEAVPELQQELPMDAGFATLVGVELEEEFLVFTYTLENLYLPEEVLTSERNIAGMFAVQSARVFAEFLIKAELGLRASFVLSAEKTYTISLSATEFESLYNRVQSGELKPYTFLEQTEFEMAAMKESLPMTIAEGMTMVDVYIKGNMLYNVTALNTTMTADDLQLSSSDLEEDKQTIANALCQEFRARLEQLIAEQVDFCYVYQNAIGQELYRIEITHQDLQDASL